MRVRVPLDPDRASLRRGALRGAGWSALGKIGTRAGSLATFIVLARLLDPQDFGLVALSTVLITLVLLFLDLNFTHYLVQQVDLRQSVIDAAFWLSLMSGVIATVLLMASAPLFAFALDEPRLGPVLLVLAGTIPLGAMSAVPQALLRRSLAFDVITMRGLVGIAASSAVGISLALAGAGVWALVAQVYAQNLANLVLFFGLARWRPSLTCERRASIDILRYGRDLWGLGFMQFLSTRGDEFVLGVVAGSQDLGIYSVAKRVVIFATDVFGGVVLQVGPAVLAAAKHDKDRVRRGYLAAVAVTAAVVTPVTMILAAVSAVLVPLVFGAQWALAGPVSQLVAVGAVMVVLTQLDRGLFLALDMPRVELRTAAGTALVGLLVAGASALSGLLVFTLTVTVWRYVAWAWRLRVKRRHASIPTRSVVRLVGPVWATAATAGLLALGLVNVMAPQPDWAAVSLASVGGAIVFLLLLRVFGGEAVRLLRSMPTGGRWARPIGVTLRLVLGRSADAARLPPKT